MCWAPAALRLMHSAVEGEEASLSVLLSSVQERQQQALHLRLGLPLPAVHLGLSELPHSGVALSPLALANGQLPALVLQRQLPPSLRRERSCS